MRRFLTVFSMVAIATAAVAAPVGAQRPASTNRGGSLSAANLQPTKMLNNSKSDSGQIAQSDAGLLARKDGAMVNVLIKFDADAVASYRGNVAGLAATSPSITGKSLKESGATAGAYSRYLGTFARVTRGRITAAVPQANLGRNFLTAFGGVNARMPANRAKDLLKVKGVAAVMYDTWPSHRPTPHPRSSAPTRFGRASAAIRRPARASRSASSTPASGPSIRRSATPASAIRAAPTAASSAMASIRTGRRLHLQRQADRGLRVPRDPASQSPTIPDEAPTATPLRPSAARATLTATARTPRAPQQAAVCRSAVLFGVERGPVSGIAPGAHVIHYRVCIVGCFSSDSMDAVEQAIEDDVDVINFSISRWRNPYTDGVELAFLDAYAAGILGQRLGRQLRPRRGNHDHGGPWVNTVGASTSDRHFLTTLHLTADGGAARSTSSPASPSPPASQPDAGGARQQPRRTAVTCARPRPMAATVHRHDRRSASAAATRASRRATTSFRAARQA